MFVERGDDGNLRCKVVLSLSRDLESGEWFADRLVLDLGAAQNVTSFSRPTPLNSVFAQDFLAELRPFLPDGHDLSMHVDAHAVLETPRAVLGGIRVVAHQANHGIQHVVIRFSKVLGTVSTILLPKHRAENATLTSLEQSAGEALLNLLRPCIDLASVSPLDAADKGIGDQVAMRLEMLAENKEELAFFAYLLKRYIENLPDGEPMPSALAQHRRRGLADAAAR